MTIVVWSCAILTAALAVYAFGHLLVSGIALTAGPVKQSSGEASRLAVAALIPARNEGEQAVRAIRSLLNQDHRGALEIYLLLKDREDSALPFLAAAFPDADFSDDGASLVEISSGLSGAPPREVVVAFLGVDGKSAKLNAMVQQLETGHVALLDCDHQAHADWIRTSMQILAEEGASVVQGRRHPLSAHGFFQLWDSLHQHIGCEVFNLAFSRLGLTVFFTGTTVVMETALLRDQPLRACLTEDTDLSYRLVLRGQKILHNPHSGSDEELSPDHYSFLARRRRWSGGHTEVFLRSLARILSPSAPLTLAGRLQLLFHGLHYLVAVPVFLIHLIIGGIFLSELSASSLVAATVSTLILANLLSRRQKTRGLRARSSEIVVLFAWLFPAIVLAMNLGRAAVEGDLSLAALPLPGLLQIVGLIGLSAPLIVLVVGLIRFRQASVGTLLTVVLTYPAAFYLDISAVLIGLADFFASREIWRPIARAEPLPALSTPPEAGDLLPTIGIKGSWRLRALLSRSLVSLDQTMRRLLRPSRSIPLASIVGLFALGVLYSPSGRLTIADRDCQLMAQDGEPWIVPSARRSDHCTPGGHEAPLRARRAGSFTLTRKDALKSIDDTYWDRLDSTFFCNLSSFTPENLELVPGGGLKLRMEATPKGDRQYTAASIATKDLGPAKHLYGRFEARLKPAKVSGVISALFLYRFDPWQEIDAEFVGKDTSKILLNVYYNPGEEGDLYNYGFRGTPVLVDLGFDASEDFHDYAIEWDPEGIRWFVDGELIHSRTAGLPTPIPHLPMRFHINAWPICSEELAGPFSSEDLPAATELHSVSISSWAPTTSMKISAYLSGLFSSEKGSTGWRERAGWVQPGR